MASPHSNHHPVDEEDNIALERKLAYLSQADSYGKNPGKVELIETHMSWVFLTRKYVYKLKKPVHNASIDFGTIQARQFYCNEEIRLNRSLAPDVYIGTLPLTIDSNDQLQLEGRGRIVDWLVKMHRLPADRMLDHRLAAGTVRDEEADRILALLAGFYRASPPVTMAPEQYLNKIDTELRNSHEVLCSPAYALAVEAIHGIHEIQMSAMRILLEELLQRASSGKIVEGHGDLRPEHICLQEKVAIIDRLDFSLALRTLDMADEVAFLALECERLNAHGFAYALLSAYRNRLQDQVSHSLIHFYQSCRAMTRAKLAVRHLDEEQFRLSEKWIARTKLYLTLAGEHANQALIQGVSLH